MLCRLINFSAGLARALVVWRFAIQAQSGLLLEKGHQNATQHVEILSVVSIACAILNSLLAFEFFRRRHKVHAACDELQAADSHLRESFEEYNVGVISVLRTCRIALRTTSRINLETRF